jgi:hypothetical protein
VSVQYHKQDMSMRKIRENETGRSVWTFMAVGVGLSRIHHGENVKLENFPPSKASYDKTASHVSHKVNVRLGRHGIPSYGLSRVIEAQSSFSNGLLECHKWIRRSYGAHDYLGIEAMEILFCI